VVWAWAAVAPRVIAAANVRTVLRGVGNRRAREPGLYVFFMQILSVAQDRAVVTTQEDGHGVGWNLAFTQVQS